MVIFPSVTWLFTRPGTPQRQLQVPFLLAPALHKDSDTSGGIAIHPNHHNSRKCHHPLLGGVITRRRVQTPKGGQPSEKTMEKSDKYD